MLPLAHAGLTTPAVAGPGCNEGLGLTCGDLRVVHGPKSMITPDGQNPEQGSGESAKEGELPS